MTRKSCKWQSCKKKEGYKPWKCAATARYFASHTKDHVSRQQENPCQDPAGNKNTIQTTKDLTVWQRHKLKWYRHVSHWSCLIKPILQGTVKGGRRQGRQKKRWEDNIGKWTSLEFTKSQRALENRIKWRRLVVKSSVVPQRLSWLRDKWRWRWKSLDECWIVFKLKEEER